MIIIIILNWIFGLLSLLCTLLVVICPFGTLIALIVEATKKITPGTVRSFKKTLIFAVLFGIGLGGLLLIFALWGVVMYAAQMFL